MGQCGSGLAALGASQGSARRNEHARRFLPTAATCTGCVEIFSIYAAHHGCRKEFLKAVALDPNENTWLALGMLYHRGDAFRKRLRDATCGSSFYSALLANLRDAHFYLNVGAQPALAALEEALREAPAGVLGETGETSLRFKVSRAHANAWHMAGDLPRAIADAETAVQLTPDDAAAWTDLAHLYERAGRTAEQQRAEQRAAALDAGQPARP